jgi:hypothetical protein
VISPLTAIFAKCDLPDGMRLRPLPTLAISRRAGRPECPRNKNQRSNEDGGKRHNVRVFVSAPPCGPKCPIRKPGIAYLSALVDRGSSSLGPSFLSESPGQKTPGRGSSK